MRDAILFSALGVAFCAVVAFAAPVAMKEQSNGEEIPMLQRVYIAAVFVAFGTAYAVLNRNLRKRLVSAWTFQIVMASVGLVLCCGIGTLLNGLLLYNWFKPETKAWFGVKA